jgi:hypothetical protein
MRRSVLRAHDQQTRKASGCIEEIVMRSGKKDPSVGEGSGVLAGAGWSDHDADREKIRKTSDVFTEDLQ